MFPSLKQCLCHRVGQRMMWGVSRCSSVLMFSNPKFKLTVGGGGAEPIYICR